MAQEQLRQAFALMKQGDKRQATQIVQSVIKQDRNNVSAWWLLANVLDDNTKKQKAAEKTLSLDSNHAGAKKMLAALTGNTTPVKQAPTRSSPPPPTTNSEEKTEIELEFDWGKLDARDAKQKKVDAGSEHKAIKMASYLMIGFFFVVIIGASLFVGIPAYRNNQVTIAIQTSMTGFLDTMMVGDFEAAEAYVCEQYHMDQERENNFARGLRPTYAQFQADLSALEIEVSDITSDSARATLTGDISLIPTEGEQQVASFEAIMGEDGFRYETTSFRFILENEQWRICDASFRSES